MNSKRRFLDLTGNIFNTSPSERFVNKALESFSHTAGIYQTLRAREFVITT